MISIGTRICIGCGREYEPTGYAQKRCKAKCGYFNRGYANARPSRSHRTNGLEFIGVDGEGVTDPDGTHRYVLLSVGDQSLTAQSDDGRLTFHEIMPFLWEQYLAHPNAAFVGFYLSYDFSQWFRDLPADRAKYLFTEFGRALRTPKGGNRILPFPVRFGGWEFDMLGLRRFKLRPCPGDDTHDYANTKQGWLYICDSGPFWQTSLLNAINPKNWGNEPILTDSEWDVIRTGKAHRADAQLDKTMIRYNVTENDILARVTGKLERGFAAQGWNLKKSHWFGPGQAAQTWLNNIKAPSGDMVREKTPPAVLLAAQQSYYGGWFEIPRHGIIKGTTYEYDINSAYPKIISHLPCLLHGEWHHDKRDRGATDKRDSTLYELCRVTTRGSDPYLGGLPHRNKDGIISRPQSVTGWYWRQELDAAQRAGLVDTVTVHETWTYTPCHCLPPLRSIAELYNERLSIGKNTAHGKALKLVYNSAYGKFAQSIGEPKYANAVYASLITSGCRTMILDAIATHPKHSADVLMIATDGIYFRTPHPTLPISDNTLGLWDVGTKENLCLFMPGVYWDDKSRAQLRANESVQLKSRGINAAELATQIDYIDAQFDHFEKWPTEWPEATIPIRFSVTSPQLALARGKWETCGAIKTWEHHGLSRELSSHPGNKRDVNRGWWREDGIITTAPYAERGRNYGYDKTFGSTLESLIDHDQYITDDGTINMELVEMLKG